jgi:hypothetical protein
VQERCPLRYVVRVGGARSAPPHLSGGLGFDQSLQRVLQDRA